MDNTLSNQNKEMTAHEDIEKMRDSLVMGRFTLDFEGMEETTVMQRAEFIRRGLYAERIKLPQNSERLVNEVNAETDRDIFLPNVHFICKKLCSSADARFTRARNAYLSAVQGGSVRPGRKAEEMRRVIDLQYAAETEKLLSGERKRIDAQKKAMEKYVRMAPDSPYTALISDILKKNGESYKLASEYLTAQATASKYEAYEKQGVLTEEEKKLCVLAKEVEQAARLRLTDHKESVCLMMERDAVIRFDNKRLKVKAHESLLRCAEGSLAFIEIPKEATERALEHGLDESEKRYYRALREKKELTGFHPFKKMALSREIKKAAVEYNGGLLLLSDTPENKLRHPPLKPLEEWKAQNGTAAQKTADTVEAFVKEKPSGSVEEKADAVETVRLDLGERLHTQRAVTDVTLGKAKEKDVRENEKEI